jgi:PAS domain S-box-containing protein
MYKQRWKGSGSHLMRILIADDSIIFRRLLEATLVKRGYEVMAVGDGLAALNALQQPDAPSLAILDVNMPGINGTEICRKLREAPKSMPTYTLLLTANDSKADLVAGLESGADDYVIKPFDGDELCARVQVGLRIIELQRRLAEQVNVLEDNARQIQRHTRQALLGADIGAAFTESAPLQLTLKRCTEFMVHHLEAAFARIWTLNADGDVLELQASAGLSPHLDSKYRRVPIGQFKIGRIAQERKPHLTNDVQYDPHIGDRESAYRAGINAFAGYPLIIENRLLGVMAMFSRLPFVEDTLKVLASVATTISQGIERKRGEEAVQRSEEKYRSLIANIPDVTWIADRNGQMTFISPNIERVSGHTAEDFYRTQNYWFNQIHPDDLEMMKSAYLSLFKHNTSYDVNYRLQRKDGEWIWVHDRAVATHEKDGEMYADGVFADITERRRIEEALRLSEEHLRRSQKLESIGQLAAGIAHEINTPLQYVGDNTRFTLDSFSEVSKVLEKYAEVREACQAGGPTPELMQSLDNTLAAADLEYLLEEIPTALSQSLEGVGRVTKIVQSMKDFAHPGEDKKATDLNKAIESTITVARNEWKYVADLTTDFDPELPMIPCMLGEFNQVILNMIVNASHAITDVVGDASETKGLITISTRRAGEWAEIRISDTGAGIPEKARNRIFDPFFTTKDVGKGTGQGLAISHGVIVEKHGGSIEFETELGRGTTFIVRLPVQGTKSAAAVQ